MRNLAGSISSFDACLECGVVACFYHHANWWVEGFINSEEASGMIEDVEDDNFFL
jgi:hypothetical protein